MRPRDSAVNVCRTNGNPSCALPNSGPVSVLGVGPLAVPPREEHIVSIPQRHPTRLTLTATSMHVHRHSSAFDPTCTVSNKHSCQYGRQRDALRSLATHLARLAGRWHRRSPWVRNANVSLDRHSQRFLTPVRG